MLKINLTKSEIASLNNLLDNGGTKVEAMRLVRNASRHIITDLDTNNVLANTGLVRYPSTNIGLAQAKDAVELYMSNRGCLNEKGEKYVSPANPRGVIVQFQPIKRIVVNMGSGDVELDLEEMSLKFLSEMKSATLNDISALIDLYTRVKEWTDIQSA